MAYFENKVVVLTGAGSGIGRALAIELSNRGARLALIDIRKDKLDETLQLIKSTPENCSIHVADIMAKKQVEKFVEEAVDHHTRVDILINNAGMALGRLQVDEMTEGLWEKIIRTNFGGTLNCINSFMPHLLKSKSPHIVNTSSIFGTVAVKERSGYCVSKSAVNILTETLRQELKESNMNFSLVIPGGVKTDLTYHASAWKSKEDQLKAAKMQKEKSGMSAEKAAKIIVKGIMNKKYRILVGKDAKLLDLISRITPTHYGAIMNYFIRKAEIKANQEK